MSKTKGINHGRNTMISTGYTAPQTEDEQSEEDREALDQYDGPTEIDPWDLPDGYEGVES